MRVDTRNSMASDVKLSYRTPADFLDRVYEVAPIALDPAAHPYGLVKARHYIYPRPGWQSRPDLGGGLVADWRKIAAGRGLVYLNPPYGLQIRPWAQKVVEEAKCGTEILTLVGARVDTRWFQRMFRVRGMVVLFVEGRITFVGADNGAFFPSAVFYHGPHRDRFCSVFRDSGVLAVRKR